MRTLHSPILWRLVGGFAFGTALTWGLAIVGDPAPMPQGGDGGVVVVTRGFAVVTAAALALGGVTVATSGFGVAEAAVTRSVPAPAYDPAAKGRQVAVLAGGCFWGMGGGVRARRRRAVRDQRLCGRHQGRRDVRTGVDERTGHAEAVRIVYDPARVSYGTLLRIYFSVAHDPTQVTARRPTAVRPTGPPCSRRTQPRRRWRSVITRS